MKKYKLRFESIVDLIEFIYKIHNHIDEYKGEENYTFSFKTNLSFDDILEIINQIPDSHIMYETLAPYNEYTGERNYKH